MKTSKKMLLVRKFFSLLVVSILFVTCKKTTVINNYITNPPTYSLGLVPTPASAYASIPIATLPPSGGGSLPSSYFIEIPTIAFNQGNQGSCASCATAMAKSIVDHVKNGTPYPNNKIIYSPSFLFHQVNLNPNNCSVGGSYLLSNFDVLKTQGVCKLADMPYSETDCTAPPTTNQITLASSNKIDHYFKIEPVNTSTIKQFINIGLPVIVAFKVDNHFTDDYSDPNNANRVWTSFGTYSNSNHATLLYGWDNSKNAFKMLNQWGTQWGNDGSIWVDYNLVNNSSIFFEAYIIQNGTSTNTDNLQVTGDLNFGNTTINTSSAKTIQLVNNSAASINVSSISITSPFSTNWNSGTIQAGASQNVTVTFNPSVVGNASSTLTINSNATNNPVTIQANGVGVQQTSQTKIISLSGNMSFGNVIVGQNTSSILTISNTGNSPLVVSSILTPQGFIGSYNGTIQAGGSANTSITFSPSNVQPYSGNLKVISDATSGTDLISVLGNGTQQITQTRIISLSGNLSFGNLTVGQTSSKTLTISNTGNSPLVVSSISTPQGFSGSYSGTIQSGGSANTSITFFPLNVQSYSNNIKVIANETSGTNTINANGNGVSNPPTVAPALGTYGSCAGTGSVCSYGLGIINARVVSINTSTHKIVVEIKKCNGTPFNAGGNLNVVSLLCGGGVSYGFGSFLAGATTVQLTISDNNMVGSKAYVPFIVQGASLNIYYSAPTIVITY